VYLPTRRSVEGNVFVVQSVVTVVPMSSGWPQLRSSGIPSRSTGGTGLSSGAIPQSSVAHRYRILTTHPRRRRFLFETRHWFYSYFIKDEIPDVAARDSNNRSMVASM